MKLTRVSFAVPVDVGKAILNYQGVERSEPTTLPGPYLHPLKEKDLLVSVLLLDCLSDTNGLGLASRRCPSIDASE